MTVLGDQETPPVYFHYGKGGHSWAYAVIDGFYDAFKSLGYTCYKLSGDGDAVQAQLTSQAYSGSVVWLIDLNGRLVIPAGLPNILKFSIIVDHPFLRTEDLASARSGDCIGVCDQSHLAAITAIRRDLNAIFLPHAGPLVAEHVVPISDRNIPILFAGGLPAYPGTGYWRDQNPDVPDDIATAVIDAAEIMVQESLPVLSAFKQTFAPLYEDPLAAFSPKTLIRIVEHIERLAEDASRSAMLLALKDLPVHLIAPGLPDFLKPLPDNWYFAGECSATELHSLMADVKVVLNPVVKFPFGAHDRIFNAQSQGALVATPHSNYLANDYRDEESILFVEPYSKPNEFADQLSRCWDNDDWLANVAQNGTAIYAQRHTWQCRAVTIIEALQNL